MLPFYISSPPNFVSNTSSQVYIVNVFYHLCPQPCPHRPFPTNHVVMVIVSFFASLFFLALNFFVSSAWSLFFFIPTTMANDLRLQRISMPDFISILILEKEPVFPFSMLSATKQGNYWHHNYFVFGMTRSLTGD